jgi:hypothetical protein
MSDESKRLYQPRAFGQMMKSNYKLQGGKPFTTMDLASQTGSQNGTVTRRDMIRQARERSAGNYGVGGSRNNQYADFVGNHGHKPVVDDTASKYSYSAKSRVIYSRGMQKKK